MDFAWVTYSGDNPRIAPMRHRELQLLGGFRATVDGVPVPAGAWETRRAAELVQLLALTHGRHLHGDEVLEALWPHLDPEAGRSNLHKAASYARKALGDRESLVLLGGRVSLAPDAEVVIDVDSYERLAQDALVSGEPGRCAEVSVLPHHVMNGLVADCSRRRPATARPSSGYQLRPAGRDSRR